MMPRGNYPWGHIFLLGSNHHSLSLFLSLSFSLFHLTMDLSLSLFIVSRFLNFDHHHRGKEIFSCLIFIWTSQIQFQP